MLGQCWGNTGALLGHVWALLGQYPDSTGAVLGGQSWGNVGAVLGLYPGCTGAILVQYWGGIGGCNTWETQDTENLIKRGLPEIA